MTPKRSGRMPPWVPMLLAVPVAALALSTDADLVREIFARAALGLIALLMIGAAVAKLWRGEDR